MKTLLLSLACAALTTASVQAQVFRPETTRNMIIGGVAGAIIGDNHHHQALEGAVIGAAAGYLIDQATQRSYDYAPPVPVYAGYGRRVVVAQPRCAPPVIVGRRHVVVAPPVVVYREAPRHHRHGRVAYAAPRNHRGGRQDGHHDGRDRDRDRDHRRW